MQHDIIRFFERGFNARDHELPLNEYCQGLLIDQVVRHKICQNKEGKWVKDADVNAFKTQHGLHGVLFVWE